MKYNKINTFCYNITNQTFNLNCLNNGVNPFIY